MRTRTIRSMGRGTVLATAALVLATGLSTPAVAQEPAALSLEEALELARRHNPTFQATRNNESAAAWAVRESWAGFLPRASVSGGMRYEEGGAALLGNFTAEDIGLTETPSYYFSSYGAAVTMGLSGQTFFNLAQARANRRAVSAGVNAAEVTLENSVKQAYLAVLRAREMMELRQQELERAEENLRLAEARLSAGVAIPLDAKQARVERGRAQVNALTSQSDFETGKLRLLQLLGLDIDRDVMLTTEFEVFEPQWSRDALVERAERAHPLLRSLAATAGAQRAAARTAWSSYLPSLAMRAGWSGYTRQVGSDQFLLAQAKDRFAGAMEGCEEFNDLNSRLANPYPPRDCSRFELTPTRVDSIESAVVASNRAFPFDFEQQPLSVSLEVSLPVFTGFSRQRQVAQAAAAADDTEHQLEATRLQLKADVAAALLRLRTAWQTVQLEETNRTVAAEQLEQARERYRVGLDSFVDLTDAATLATQADQAYVAAVYTFHEALADLEAAVGEPLRPVAP